MDTKQPASTTSIGGGYVVSEEAQVLVRVEALKKHFPIGQGFLSRRRGVIKAVDGVSFEIYRGETLGLVGESGCGKSTTGRAILQLHRPTSGRVIFDGQDLTTLGATSLRKLRTQMQMIFQDPYASLNPRHSIGKIIGEPLVVHRTVQGEALHQRVVELLELVGLNPIFTQRFPHEFSGGQRQRVGVARALALNPKFVVCDEPISALDVSIQAQIVNLLQDLQEQLGLTYLFIAHDLSMVRHISDKVAVMYLGKFMELADRAEIYTNPLHPYTQSLISAVPVPNPRLERQRKRITLKGEVPSPANPPQGCVFNTRCPLAEEVCFHAEPEYRQVRPKHYVACHLVPAEVTSS
jgi:oligopeptide transport system ATP-binding protein